MRELPTALQAHLNSRATTLCWCWKLIKPTGLVLGFTNHDEDIEFGGDSVVYKASTGFTATESITMAGLSSKGHEVSGALSDDRITEEELRAGQFDNSKVEVWLVNWEDTTEYFLMGTYILGEISRGDTYFHAEMRGFESQLQQKRGRIYQYTCDVELGGTKCGVDLSDEQYQGSGTVTTTDGWRYMVVSGIADKERGFFKEGKLTFTSGNNDGTQYTVKAHDSSVSWQIPTDAAALTLYDNTAYEIQVDDTFSITAGCDKLFTTCKNKFSNQENFRGFPHIPGNDFILYTPTPDDPDLDGEGRWSAQ
jgi:uncharacterized phage protein (TIGR02218 family)